MKRLLLFASVLFGTALLIFLLVVGLNWDSYETLFANREGLREGTEWIEKTYSLQGLTQYMGQNPEKVSVVSYTLTEPDSGIYYRADAPRSMGALSNIFLLIEYARQVQHDALDPNSLISIDSINRYKLPEIDNGAHEDALSTLRERGKIKNNQMTLETAARALAEFNDLAIADFLYFKFGGDALDSLQQHLKLINTQKILPFSGLYISLSPELQNMSYDSLSSKLQAMDRQAINNHVISNAGRYQTDTGFREQVHTEFSDNGLGLLFTRQRDLQSTLFPTSTARDLSSVMYQLQQNELLSEEVSNLVLDLLSWPLQQQQMRNDFEQYGAIYDNRLGILNGVDTGVSAYTGATYVQAVLFDDLPVGFWVHMSSNHMHQDYQQRLIWDPALQQETRDAVVITNKNMKPVN